MILINYEFKWDFLNNPKKLKIDTVIVDLKKWCERNGYGQKISRANNAMLATRLNII
jgi:hypothetical protein